MNASSSADQDRPCLGPGSDRLRRTGALGRSRRPRGSIRSCQRRRGGGGCANQYRRRMNATHAPEPVPQNVPTAGARDTAANGREMKRPRARRLIPRRRSGSVTEVEINSYRAACWRTSTRRGRGGHYGDDDPVVCRGRCRIARQARRRDQQRIQMHTGTTWTV